MPHRRVPADRLIVCDCLTLFVAMVGPKDGAATTLVSLFLGNDPGGMHGVTTNEEFDRARLIVRDHGRKRAEKFPASAVRLAQQQFDALAADNRRQFEVRDHPTVSTIPGRPHDDHLLLLSAAVSWGAGFFSTYNADLRRMKSFGNIQIGTPEQILAMIER